MNIGLTGKNASGKGEVAKILQELGYTYYSLSDAIRAELKKENKETSRDNLIAKGNELREKFGPGVLGIKIRKMVSDKNNVIDSVRNPFEVQELKKLPNFTLIGIYAPIELRFERLSKRKRTGDIKTLKELKEKEDLENSSNDTSQQLDKTFSMSNIVIKNDETIDELKAKVLNMINELKIT